MSSANTSTNCLLCFSRVHTYCFQQQNQKYLTPSEIIGCCSKHLSKEFIDSIKWTNDFSTAGSLCQECDNIAEKLYNLNINLNKIIEEINGFGTRLNIRISKERRNYEVSTQKPSELTHSSSHDINQVSGLAPNTAVPTKRNEPDWNCEVQKIHAFDFDQNKKSASTTTDKFNFVSDSLDDSNESFLGSSNCDVESRDNGEICQLSPGKPIKVNNKREPRKIISRQKEIEDTITAGNPVSKQDEIIIHTERQQEIEIGLEADVKCNKCSKKFSTMATIKSHDCSKQTYECEVCQTSFFTTAALKRHMLTHTGEKPYECEVCKKSFSLADSLKLYMRSHTGEKPYECEMCKRSFPRSGQLKSHMRTHTGEKPYKCKVCKKSFSLTESLKHHMRTHTGEKPYTCKMCSKSYSRLETLKEHIRTHTGEKPYKCEICGKCFAVRRILFSHRTTHSDERPIKCTLCEKAFRDIRALKSHLPIHKKIPKVKKPKVKIIYKCDICAKIVSRPDSLRLHLLRHETGPAQDPVVCKVCGKWFKQSESLKAHIFRCHNHKDIPAKCEECETVFMSEEILQNHIKNLSCTKINTKQKRENCEQTFATNYERQMHKIEHLAPYERPSFICPYCNMSFQLTLEVWNHHKRVHSDLAFPFKRENFPCQVYKTDFTLMQYIIIHLEKHTNEQNKIRCEHCAEVFSSICECTVHRRLCHSKQNSSFDCSKCNISLEDDRNLTAHIKSYHSGSNPVVKVRCNKEQGPDSPHNMNYLTWTSKYKKNDSKEFESSRDEDDKGDNESQDDSGSQSLHDEENSNMEIKVESDLYEEIKIEYSDV